MMTYMKWGSTNGIYPTVLKRTKELELPMETTNTVPHECANSQKTYFLSSSIVSSGLSGGSRCPQMSFKTLRKKTRNTANVYILRALCKTDQ